MFHLRDKFISFCLFLKNHFFFPLFVYVSSCPVYQHIIRPLDFFFPFLLRTKAQHRSYHIHHQLTWADSCLIFHFCHFFLIDLLLYEPNLNTILCHSYPPSAPLPHKEHASTGTWGNLLEFDTSPKVPAELTSFLTLLWTQSYRFIKVPTGHQIQSHTVILKHLTVCLHCLINLWYYEEPANCPPWLIWSTQSVSDFFPSSLTFSLFAARRGM